ncbi:uncharacterized protein LOC6649201 isoform X2 [Drosophila willistoni]|uniref:uncharacterized protein LOC6649201 isoform X2 n=1 Tax=Drosophila willistoni TaxID=7260 RepID=UPI000C26DAF9|nr:uncharacterized protein LOC6649201 isoform X2 [Drosophila willistoni]
MPSINGKCWLMMVALLSLSLSLALTAPAPQQQQQVDLQDSIEPELNPINAESKPRRARAGGKDLNDAANITSDDVSLDFPGELLNKSFQTITNVSQSLSRLIMNSARRYSRFVLFFKPIFGDALVVRGSEDPTTTTTSRPTTAKTTATNEESEKLNEI